MGLKTCSVPSNLCLNVWYTAPWEIRVESIRIFEPPKRFVLPFEGRLEQRVRSTSTRILWIALRNCTARRCKEFVQSFTTVTISVYHSDYFCKHFYNREQIPTPSRAYLNGVLLSTYLKFHLYHFGQFEQKSWIYCREQICKRITRVTQTFCRLNTG